MCTYLLFVCSGDDRGDDDNDREFACFGESEGEDINEEDDEDEDVEDTEEEDTEEEDNMPTTPKKAASGTTTGRSTTPTKSTRSSLKKPKAATTNDIDDLTSRMSQARVAPLGYSMKSTDEYKTCNYIKTLNNGVQQIHEVRVDTFPGKPILPEQVKVSLTPCGWFLKYRVDSPSWIATHNHFQREWLKDNIGLVWDPSNTKNMAIFARAQEIRAAFPTMDDGNFLRNTDELIPLPIQCIGSPYDLIIRHIPTPVVARFLGADYITFFFKVSLHIKGAQEILVRNAPAVHHETHMNHFEDLYDPIPPNPNA